MEEVGGVFLRSFLLPFREWLDRPDVTEVMVNQPGEVWVEQVGAGMQRFPAPGIDAPLLGRLAAQAARSANQGVNREQPLLSAALPTGERLQVVAPPATRKHLALSIRKQVTIDLTLEDYVRSGAFAEASLAREERQRRAADDHLRALLAKGEVAEFLRQAVLLRQNILISGGTSSGKTTFLNALLKAAPAGDRIVVIEDTPEIVLTQPNAVGLVTVRGRLGEAQVNAEDLLGASLRMRPDRIVLGELRGAEAMVFLRAINTGHPGSITTIHADTPRGALDQLTFLSLQSGINLGRADIADYVSRVLDVVVQLKRTDKGRVVSAIAFRDERGQLPL